MIHSEPIMMMRTVLLGALAAPLSVLPATPALAADAVVDVRGPDGRPLAGAVVEIVVPGGDATPRGGYSVEQRNISFQPGLLIVPVGASVAFPNRDKVRHHVYSFSKAKKFELKLYGREEQRTVTFDRPGVVTLGCNIHDSMSGVVYVASSRFAAQTDTNGRVTLSGLPAGGATIRVWHPTIRAANNTLTQSATITASGLKTTLTIRR